MSLSIGTQIEMVEIWLRDGDPLDLIDDGTSLCPRAVLEEVHKSLRWLMQLLAEVPVDEGEE